MWVFVFFFQAEDGIRDLVRSRGLGDVYKRQAGDHANHYDNNGFLARPAAVGDRREKNIYSTYLGCLLYTSDAADERSSVDLGGRRIIKKKTKEVWGGWNDCDKY